MTATFYRNQYTDGGAVTAEKWQLFDASRVERVYGDCYSLETKEVELPEGLTTCETKWGEKVVCDGDDICELIYNEKTDRMDAVSINGVTRIW